MGLAIASIWVFLMSITNILTVFYYSNDIEMLLPLPLKPAQIISAKFLTVLITQYVMSSFILLPIFITYGFKKWRIYYILHIYDFYLLTLPNCAVSTSFVTDDSYYEVYKYSEK